MVVAFSTSYWAIYSLNGKEEFGGYGLWKTWKCSMQKQELGGSGNGIVVSKKICQESFADSSLPGWYVATQVLESLGFAGLLASLIMLLFYAFHPQWDRSKTAVSTLIAISYMSGLCIMVGLFVFGFSVVAQIRPSADYLSWSFSLAATAFVLNEIAASILITETRRLSDPNYKTQTNSNNIGELRAVLITTSR